MIAVSRGSPATTNERNVTISTSRAMSRPTRLGERDARHRQGEQVAAELDLRAGGQLVAQLRGDVLQRRLRLRRHVGRLAVELHADDRRVAVVRDLAVHDLVERIGHREHRRRGLRARAIVSAIAEAYGSSSTWAPSAVTMIICALVPLACGNVRLSCSMPACDFGARDREGVVGALPERDGAAAGDAEQQQPRDQHAPRSGGTTSDRARTGEWTQRLRE